MFHFAHSFCLDTWGSWNWTTGCKSQKSELKEAKKNKLFILIQHVWAQPIDDDQLLSLKAFVAIMKRLFLFIYVFLHIGMTPAWRYYSTGVFSDEAEWMNSFLRVLIQVKQQLGIDCGENALGT